MKRLLTFLVLITFCGSLSTTTFAKMTNFAGGKKISASTKKVGPSADQLFKAEKADYTVGETDKEPAIKAALLEEVYNVYGVEGLQKLNSATTRDELKIILTSLKDSPQAQELVQGALPTRIANSITGTTYGNDLSAPLVDMTIFDQIEAGAASVNWAGVSAPDECSLCCLPCCH